MESTHSLTDRLGASYRVEFIQTQVWSVYAWRDGGQAGYAYCVEEKPVLKVNDLFVHEVMPMPETRWSRIWRRLGGRPVPTYPNRRRGLGSALLDFIVRQAKAGGFSRLEGEIFAKDFAANPKLSDWYRQRGFTVNSLPPGTQRIAAVVREL